MNDCEAAEKLNVWFSNIFTNMEICFLISFNIYTADS